MRCLAYLLDRLLDVVAPIPPLPSKVIGADLLAEAEEDEEVWPAVGEYPPLPPKTARPGPPTG